MVGGEWKGGEGHRSRVNPQDATGSLVGMRTYDIY